MAYVRYAGFVRRCLSLVRYIRMLKRLKDRYERRNPIALFSMCLADALAWFIVQLSPNESKRPISSALSKVLLVNPAHIGDVVISTAAIRRLKEVNPKVSIGFVVGSWAKIALEEHPGIDRLFVVDHWRLNRAKASTLQKIWRYIQTWRETRKALMAEGYDAAILLNSFSPNLASLLWYALIPLRAGYVSAGMSPLSNVVLPKPSSTVPEQKVQLTLLDSLGFYGASKSWLEVSQADVVDIEALGITSPFVVLHPGTGNPAKGWLLERWVSVAAYLNKQGFEVVLTGQGPEEQRVAAQICAKTPACNLVGALPWAHWLQLLGAAKLVIGVDSVVGHVCAALNKPFVGIYSGIGMVKRWAPTGSDITVLTKAMPCSPCHTRPCAERQCITAVTVQDVIDAANTHLSQNHVG